MARAVVISNAGHISAGDSSLITASELIICWKKLAAITVEEHFLPLLVILIKYWQKVLPSITIKEHFLPLLVIKFIYCIFSTNLEERNKMYTLCRVGRKRYP